MNKYWCSSFFIVDKQSAVVVGDDSINIDYSQFFLLCSRKKTIMGRKEQRDMCVLLVEGVCLFDCAFSCLHRGKTPKMGRLNKNSLPSGGINSDLKPPVAFTLSLLLLLPCFLFRKRVATAQRFFSSLLLTCKQIVMELSLKRVPVSRKSTCSAAFWKKKGKKKLLDWQVGEKKTFWRPITRSTDVARARQIGRVFLLPPDRCCLLFFLLLLLPLFPKNLFTLLLMRERPFQ